MDVFLGHVRFAGCVMWKTKEETILTLFFWLCLGSPHWPFGSQCFHSPCKGRGCFQAANAAQRWCCAWKSAAAVACECLGATLAWTGMSHQCFVVKSGSFRVYQTMWHMHVIIWALAGESTFETWGATGHRAPFLTQCPKRSPGLGWTKIQSLGWFVKCTGCEMYRNMSMGIPGS
jgi:hypothetical protein